MADNVRVKDSASGLDIPVAADDIGGVEYQRIKLGWGADGIYNELTDTDGIRIPVGGGQIGALTETAPGTDTASSGLNGRLQRIAQRLTSLIAQLPATLGQKTMANALAVVLASDQSAIPVTLLRRETVIQMSVAAGGTTASFVDTAGYGNMALQVPSTFDGTQIQWQGSYNGSVVADLYDITNQPVIMTIAAGRGYDLPGELTAWRWLRIVCLTTQATTTTDFQLVLRS